MQISLEISPDKKYNFPLDISTVEFEGKYIIIAVKEANWIVLNSLDELDAFEKLKVKKVAEVYGEVDTGVLMRTLLQLEAKQFEVFTAEEEDIERGLCLYLTTKCNMCCIHCYMYAGEAQEKELNTIEITKLLDDFVEYGGKKLTISGGEVVIRPDFETIVKHAKSRGLLITVLTNGVLWDSGLIQALNGYIDEVQVSIDGYDKSTYNAVRKFGFDEATQAVEAFLQAGYKTTIAITPLAANLDNEVDKYVLFASDWLNRWINSGLSIKFSHEILRGRNVNPTDITNQQYRYYIEQIVERLYPNNKLNSFVINRRSRRRFKNCGFGEISVQSNGDVYFCNRVFELPAIANIRSMPFGEIMNLSRCARKMSEVDNLKPCSNCEIRYICGGGCRIKYFSSITNCNDLNVLSIDNIPARECCYNEKMEFYRLMIDTNELLYCDYDSKNNSCCR
ncbi:radical SAM protein [Akkermansia glycaniphila]|uniref:radical SAM/SPASM domain-containing protein n=1 Tax=Akkermansia glycaniphila TaxID=1679444 RepID=UPI001C02B53A|nr:radical SAM protein [Akkermansia glycaniphila]MBT9449513.1 radical SAM protein [Akkermansia glycaniphila]